MRDDPSYDEVKENQDENELTLGNAVGSVDKNIEKVFPDADVEARVVAILAAMDRAVCAQMRKVHGTPRKEVDRYLATMYRALVQVHEMCEDGPILDAGAAAKAVVNKFWDE